MSGASQLDVALFWAGELRLPLFPTSPGSPYKQRPKTPLVATGFKAATTDLDLIKRWWGQNPAACPATPTGERIIVVDVDRHVGAGDGFASIKALEDAGFRLPETWLTVATPSGGRHFYYRAPAKPVRSRKLAPDVDLKSLGGYVLIPGSILSDGRGYTVMQGGVDA